MDNFSIVFATIKKDCTVDNNYSSVECYQNIVCALAGRQCLAIDFYIDCLSHLNIIISEESTNKIFLTEKGRQTEVLFI